MGILRRNEEDLNLLCIIFNQDIRRLATQVCMFLFKRKIYFTFY